MKKYRSSDVQKYFDVSSETVRQWASTFARHLDVLGSPPKGRHRVYSGHDLKIFATISTLKDDGLTYDEIHASLDNGTLVEFEPDDKALAPNTQIDTLQDEIAELKATINRQQGEIAVLSRLLTEREAQLFEAKHRLKLLTDGKGG